jgi:MFS transporter, DHA2 family, multidrug resistance protein
MSTQTLVADIEYSAEPSPRGTARQWAGLAVLTLPALLISMDFSVLNLAVPAISRDLAPSAGQVLWIVDVYGFMLAGFLVTMGGLGDRIGRRRLLTAGAAAFGVVSVAAAYAPDPEMLIVARGLLGVAGATLMPSTLALIGELFPDPAERGRALALWSTSLPLGGVIGPLAGGVLLQWFWWGSVFLIAVPVMALLLVAAPLLLPEHRDAGARLPDPISVVLAPTATLALVFALQNMAHHGVQPIPVVVAAGGLLLGRCFVRRQRSVADPLVDLSLLRLPGLRAALGVNTLVFFAILGISLLIAQYLQLVVNLTALQAGLCTLPMMGGLIVGDLLVAPLTSRMPTTTVNALGLIVAAAGFASIAMSTRYGLVVVVTGSAVLALGLAPVTTLVVATVLQTAPAEKAAAASGISETTTELGGALGIAVLGTVAAALYRHAIDRRLPSTVPTGVRRASQETLEQATTAANGLPRELASTIIDTARHAFTTGLAATAIAAAVVMLTLAAVMLLHRSRTIAAGRVVEQSRR